MRFVMRTNWLLKSSPAAGHVLAILRMVVAFLFISAGTMKMFGFPSRGSGGEPIGFDPFTQIGLAAIIEVIGGTLVLFGLATRPAAFIMSGEMAVAYFQVYAPKAFFPVINGGASAALFCWVFLYLSFVGAGPWSLDALIASSRPASGREKVGSMRLHLAEFLLAILFVAGGFSTLRDPKPRAAQLARLGFPFADLSVRVNAALMVVAGLALAINYYPAAASVVLAISAHPHHRLRPCLLAREGA